MVGGSAAPDVDDLTCLGIHRNRLVVAMAVIADHHEIPVHAIHVVDVADALVAAKEAKGAA